jgi:hypothetical protein
MTMLESWSRWAPLTGVISAVLGVAGAVIEIVTNAPGSDASGRQVIDFYSSHSTAQQGATILFAFAFVFFVFFAASLRTFIVRTPRLETLGVLILAGAVIEAVGQTQGGGYVWALAQDSRHLDASAALALNILSSDSVVTNTAGLIVFGIAAGLAILRSGSLPKALGWVAIAMAVVVVTPLEALSFIALVIWMAIVSVLLLMRGRGSISSDAV